MQHDFADGKYTVINDNGKLTALRHGEPWNRDLCGDNLIYWMLVDYDKMKEQRDELLEALQTIKDSTAVLNHLDQDSIDMVCSATAKANNT